MDRTAPRRQSPAKSTRRKHKYRGVATTRLERFIRTRGLLLSEVGNASHVCRQRLLLWRFGKAWPMLTSIRKLVRGMRAVTDDPNVKANDLFPLDDDD
jgi:hypothetical protein